MYIRLKEAKDLIWHNKLEGRKGTTGETGTRSTKAVAKRQPDDKVTFLCGKWCVFKSKIRWCTKHASAGKMLTAHGHHRFVIGSLSFKHSLMEYYNIDNPLTKTGDPYHPRIITWDNDVERHPDTHFYAWKLEILAPVHFHRSVLEAMTTCDSDIEEIPAMPDFNMSDLDTAGEVAMSQEQTPQSPTQSSNTRRKLALEDTVPKRMGQSTPKAVVFAPLTEQPEEGSPLQVFGGGGKRRDGATGEILDPLVGGPYWRNQVVRVHSDRQPYITQKKHGNFLIPVVFKLATVGDKELLKRTKFAAQATFNRQNGILCIGVSKKGETFVFGMNAVKEIVQEEASPPWQEQGQATITNVYV